VSALGTVSPAIGQVVAVAEIQVVSETTGEPIGSAEVAVPGVGASLLTDASGRAYVRGLPPGSHLVRVAALGYRSRSLRLEAENGRVTHLRVGLTPDPVRLPGFQVVSEDSPPGGIDVIRVRTSELNPGVGDLPTALEGIPGVTVVRRGGPGAPATLQLRGSGSDQILVLLDGMPLNSPLTGEVDLNGIALSSIETIQVLPGARSSRYGPRALGGVVLLETRSRQRNAETFRLGAGGWGERKVAAETLWNWGTAWVAEAEAHWDRSRGDFSYDVPEFRGGGEARRENSASRRAGGSLRIGRSGEFGTATVRLHLSDARRGSAGPVAQPSVTGKQRHSRQGLSLAVELGGESRGISLAAGVQGHQAEYEDPSPPLGEPYHDVARVSQRDVQIEGWGELGSVGIRGGGEFRSLLVRSNSLTRPSSAIEEGGIWSRVEVTGTPPWARNAGIVLDFRVDHHELVAEAMFSPSIRGVLDLGPLALEAAYRDGFSPPTLSDLFFQEGVLARANPELRPERIHGEVSLTLRSRLRYGRATLDSRVSVYDADVDDMILWFPDFRFVWSPENFDVEREGIEVGSGIQALVLGRPLSLTGQAHWSWVHYRGKPLTGQVPYRPRFTAQAATRWTWNRAAPSLRFTYVGPRRSIAGSPLNALPGYHLLDVAVAVPLHLGIADGQIDMTLSNVDDQRPSLMADYPLPGRGWAVALKLLLPHGS
jgi:hypothetical protein